VALELGLYNVSLSRDDSNSTLVSLALANDNCSSSHILLIPSLFFTPNFSHHNFFSQFSHLKFLILAFSSQLHLI